MTEISYAPIVVFCYNRIDAIQILFETLQMNELASKSDLFVFCDGPKSPNDKQETEKVRNFVKNIKGFKTITIKENENNCGLADSIINGVSKVFEQYDSAIILEDDLILSSNFLYWMNQCLQEYQNNDSIFSISGFAPSILKSYKKSIPDVFFTMKAHSWGWATWKDRWVQVDWSLKDWSEFSTNKKKQKEFASIGHEMPGLLFDYMEGRRSTWWARFCYTQFKKRKYTVYPVLSKVINEGFTDASTNCNVYNRFRVDFDKTGKIQFDLPEVISENNNVSKNFFFYYSISFRIIGKIKTLLMKMGILKQYTIDYKTIK